MNEEQQLSFMWLLLAQLGMKIDTIQDNGTVNFSVPSSSDYTGQAMMPINRDQSMNAGVPISGELLLEMASNFFKENGLTPNGRIRQEYWTYSMGQFTTAQMQVDMGLFGEVK